MPTGILNILTRLKWFKEQNFSTIRTLKHRNHLADIFLSIILWTIHLLEMRRGGGKRRGGDREISFYTLFKINQLI